MDAFVAVVPKVVFENWESRSTSGLVMGVVISIEDCFADGSDDNICSLAASRCFVRDGFDELAPCFFHFGTSLLFVLFKRTRIVYLKKCNISGLDYQCAGVKAKRVSQITVGIVKNDAVITVGVVLGDVLPFTLFG